MMKIICNNGEGRERNPFQKDSTGWYDNVHFEKTVNPLLVYDQSGNLFTGDGEFEAWIKYQYKPYGFFRTIVRRIIGGIPYKVCPIYIISDHIPEDFQKKKETKPSEIIETYISNPVLENFTELSLEEPGEEESVEEAAIPNWYDEMSIDNWLTNKLSKKRITRYAIKLLSQMISSDYANELQRAFAKGWEKAYNQAKKNGTFEYVYYPKTEKQVNELNANLIEKEKVIELLEARITELKFFRSKAMQQSTIEKIRFTETDLTNLLTKIENLNP